MSQILVVGAGLRRSRLIDQGLKGSPVRVIRKRWLTFLRARNIFASTLVIFDLAGDDTPHMDEILRLSAKMPETGILYFAAADAAGMEELSNVLQRPNVDFILNTDDPRELRLRANSLMERGRQNRNSPPEIGKKNVLIENSALRHIVSQLHASNGRLDASEISELYGISQASLARAIGISEQALHKNSDAVRIQPSLRIYERIASILLRMTGSEIGLRIWMQASNPELEDEAPLSLLLSGEGELVAKLLEDVLHGEPA